MRTNSRPRSLTLAVAVLACLSTSVSLPTVAAAPRSDVAIRDGTPDAATCARLGFVNYGQDADDGRAFYARRGAGGALHSRGGAPLNMPAPPPPAAPEPDMDTKLAHLKELASLHDAGVLTDEEFYAQKTKILG